MSLRRELESFYRMGMDAARAGVPPNLPSTGRNARYLRMAYDAGHAAWEREMAESKRWHDRFHEQIEAIRPSGGANR